MQHSVALLGALYRSAEQFEPNYNTFANHKADEFSYYWVDTDDLW